MMYAARELAVKNNSSKLPLVEWSCALVSLEYNTWRVRQRKRDPSCDTATYSSQTCRNRKTYYYYPSQGH